MDYIRMNNFYQSHMSGRWPKPWKENAEHIPQFADVNCDGLITRRNQLEVKTQNKENNTPGKAKAKVEAKVEAGGRRCRMERMNMKTDLRLKDKDLRRKEKERENMMRKVKRQFQLQRSNKQQRKPKLGAKRRHLPSPAVPGPHRNVQLKMMMIQYPLQQPMIPKMMLHLRPPREQPAKHETRQMVMQKVMQMQPWNLPPRNADLPSLTHQFQRQFPGSARSRVLRSKGRLGRVVRVRLALLGLMVGRGLQKGPGQGEDPGVPNLLRTCQTQNLGEQRPKRRSFKP
jgi:hypothetical protein